MTKQLGQLRKPDAFSDKLKGKPALAHCLRWHLAEWGSEIPLISGSGVINGYSLKIGDIVSMSDENFEVAACIVVSASGYAGIPVEGFLFVHKETRFACRYRRTHELSIRKPEQLSFLSAWHFPDAAHVIVLL